MRTISVGLSRLFRIVETDDKGYRIEQADKRQTLYGHGKGEWKWVTLAFATTWGEAHGAMHQMQQDWTDKMIERQGSFRGDRPIR